MNQIKFLIVSILFASILFIGCKNATDAQPTSSEKTEMTDAEKITAKTEISTINAQIVLDINALNVEAILKAYSKNVKGVDETGKTYDYQTLKNDLQESFTPLTSFTATMVKEDFLFISKKSVMSTWTATLEGELKTGQRFETPKHISSILYNKKDNEWKIVYQHDFQTPAKLITEE